MLQVVATFYKFVRLADFAEKQAPLLAYCRNQGIKGTILLASEGINGTIVGSRQGIDAALSFLRCDARLADLATRESYTDCSPYDRLKVRLKREIVTLGIPEVDPSQQVGTYVSADEWNHLITDPDVLLIDTRNSYEVDIGTFQGAINPKTRSFREFPDYVQQHLKATQQQKVAMFCTGGIRCEKASAFLLSRGFKQVYHLQGGILKYLAEIPPEKSLWQGECFLFDQRIALTHGLEAGSYEMCLSCGHPISDEDKASPVYEQGISCPQCFPSLTPEKKMRQQERQRQRKVS